MTFFVSTFALLTMGQQGERMFFSRALLGSSVSLRSTLSAGRSSTTPLTSLRYRSNKVMPKRNRNDEPVLKKATPSPKEASPAKVAGKKDKLSAGIPRLTTPWPQATKSTVVPEGGVLLTKLSADYQKISRTAYEVALNSYCPYSGFGVGAAILHPDGTITVGTNWENCVFQSVCAERSAIVAANAKGQRQAKAVAVWGGPLKSRHGGPGLPGNNLCTPCGVCRQMMNEVASLSGADLDIVLVSYDGLSTKVVKLSSLLPLDFGPKDVGVKLGEWSTVKLPQGYEFSKE